MWNRVHEITFFDICDDRNCHFCGRESLEAIDFSSGSDMAAQVQRGDRLLRRRGLHKLAVTDGFYVRFVEVDKDFDPETICSRFTHGG
jgi:hypothetical protein